MYDISVMRFFSFDYSGAERELFWEYLCTGYGEDISAVAGVSPEEIGEFNCWKWKFSPNWIREWIVSPMHQYISTCES